MRRFRKRGQMSQKQNKTPRVSVPAQLFNRPGLDSAMPDQEQAANNLEAYMGRFKYGLAQFATSRIQPSHNATDPTLDFSDLLRQPVSGQKHVITAGVKHLHKHKALLFVGQIGTGKTMVSMSMVHKHAAGATYHAIVFCPGQLINKWKREIETTLRGVDDSARRGRSDHRKLGTTGNHRPPRMVR